MNSKQSHSVWFSEAFSKQKYSQWWWHPYSKELCLYLIWYLSITAILLLEKFVLWYVERCSSAGFLHTLLAFSHPVLQWCVHSLSTLLDTPIWLVHLVDVQSDRIAHLLLHSLRWSSSGPPQWSQDTAHQMPFWIILFFFKGLFSPAVTLRYPAALLCLIH